jgi:hypothetical protein
VATWSYRDEASRLLGHVARFDTPSGKQILPRTWCRLPDGTEAWRWRAFSSPRPLYRLDRLAARPESVVLVVEGEKTTDAARDHFPHLVAVTWPGGAQATGLADWRALTGRNVIVWPDADAAGRKAAAAVTRLALQAGAVSAAVVPIPDHLPEGWDLADQLPEDVDIDALLAAARFTRPATDLPYGYIMTDEGLVWRDPGDEKPDLLLAGPFQVLAETRDGEGNSWGVLIAWSDNDGRCHKVPFPRAMLAGDGAEVRRILLDGGLFVASSRGAREKLTACLAAIRSTARVTATHRIGWHGSTFVLPDDWVLS